MRVKSKRFNPMVYIIIYNNKYVYINTHLLVSICTIKKYVTQEVARLNPSKPYWTTFY